MDEWSTREVNWDEDDEPLRELFSTRWKRHPITTKTHFDWQLLENYKGRAIAFCAVPKCSGEALAGVYIVLPNNVLVEGQVIRFGTSIFTLTHPLHQKKGIFVKLAQETYEKCKKNGIVGTIGVPNNKSLSGFSKDLGFSVLGKFALFARVAVPFRSRSNNNNIIVKEIIKESELQSFDLALDRRKSKSGVIIHERSQDFIAWRFFKCPSYKYKVFISLDTDNLVTGLVVFRCAKRKGIPLVVIVDFIIDNTHNDRKAIATKLLAFVNKYALKTLSPFIVTLSNPFSYEASELLGNGYRRLPKQILPHEANFILKFNGYQSEQLTNLMNAFENWYFSFADFDLY